MQRITDTSYTPTESGYVGGATLENIEIFRPPEQIKHLLAGLHIENILRRNSGSTSARSWYHEGFGNQTDNRQTLGSFKLKGASRNFSPTFERFKNRSPCTSVTAKCQYDLPSLSFVV
jgi:hypothetical protein